MRTRLTPFARMFLFLIVVLPLAYFGAAYYNGEDPVANFKGWFSGQPAAKSASTRTSTGSAACADELEALKRENYQLRQELLQKSEELRLLQSDNSGGKSSSGSRQKWGN